MKKKTWILFEYELKETCYASYSWCEDHFQICNGQGYQYTYSPLHKIVWRLFIRDKNLFETLEVSHSMSNLIPLSAKQKGGLLTIDIPFILRIMELRNYGLWLWESFPIKWPYCLKPISHIKNGTGLLLLALGLIIISKII